MEKREYFCTDCQFEVQITTKHCNKCGCCIDQFDHHCVWLNLCVGKPNYRLFITTCIVNAISLIYSLIYSLAVCRPRHDLPIIQTKFPVRFDKKTLNSKGIHAIIIVNVVVDGIVIVLLIQLLIFHAYLKVKGITTYEFITRHRVKPISKSAIPASISSTKPSTDERYHFEQHVELPSQNIHSHRSRDHEDPDPPRLSSPTHNTLGNTGFSALKNESELALFQSGLVGDLPMPQRQDSSANNINKETIVRPKPRRSGGELKTPR